MLKNLIYLMRLDKPVGIFLLFWPCVWGVMLANPTFDQAAFYIPLFLLGSVFMRSAGCVINDIADRKLDAKVERTKSRPLASGAISLKQAFALLTILLMLGAAIALAMGFEILLLSLVWMPLVIAYPFMKRITWWPQAFLGITFNAGVIFGSFAVSGSISFAALILYMGAIFWTIGYDTIYAMQDRKDDIKAGIKSTALRFGDKAPYYIAACYLIFVLSVLGVGYLAEKNYLLYGFISLLLAANFMWQAYELKTKAAPNYMQMFKSNQIVGAAIAFVLYF